MRSSAKLAANLCQAAHGVQVTRVISKMTWKEAAALEHPGKVSDDAVVAFEEVRDGTTGGANVSADAAADDDDDDDDDYDDANAENSERAQQRRRYAVCDKPVLVRRALA